MRSRFLKSRYPFSASLAKEGPYLLKPGFTDHKPALDPKIRRVEAGTDYSQSIPRPKWFKPKLEARYSIENLLAEPSWSVVSLLPPDQQRRLRREKPLDETLLWEDPKLQTNRVEIAAKEGPSVNDTDDEITPAKLHHLLRLSALPLPSTPAKEAKLLADLRDHLHFVRSIQSVDTDGVEPLVTIRDETRAAVQEALITMADLQPYLDQEEKVGKNGTVRRRRKTRLEEVESQFDMKDGKIDPFKLGTGEASRRRGNMFFVRRGHKASAAATNVTVSGDIDKAD